MSDFKSTSKPVKLHIGCGTVYLDGWINIGSNSENNIEKLDMNLDLKDGLMFDDDSADFIFCEHVFEHMTWDEGLTALKELMRVLKPEGVIRIVVTDLKSIVHLYQDKKSEAMSYLRERNYPYDYEELIRLIRAAGFENYRRQFYHESTYRELRNLEADEMSTLVIEIKKEPPPLVTVCCITYNQETFIRDALNSVLSQKTDFSFEILVVDDASTDNTPYIISEYEKKYGEVIKVVYRKSNLGAIKNFVSALGMIRSKYVALNEGDDYFTDPYKLQKQVEFLETHDEYSVCCHPVTMRFDDGSECDKMFPTPEFRFYKKRLSLNDLLKHNFIQTNSVMYRWRFIEENISDVFPDSILPGDWYLHLLHAQKGDIGFIDEVMSVYRKHPGGIWSDSLRSDMQFSKHGVEIFGFYCEVYKNIANDKQTYCAKMLASAYYTIIDSLQRSGSIDTLTKLCEKYPNIFAKQFASKKYPVSPVRYKLIAFAKRHCPRFIKVLVRSIAGKLRADN